MALSRIDGKYLLIDPDLRQKKYPIRGVVWNGSRQAEQDFSCTLDLILIDVDVCAVVNFYDYQGGLITSINFSRIMQKDDLPLDGIVVSIEKTPLDRLGEVIGREMAALLVEKTEFEIDCDAVTLKLTIDGHTAMASEEDSKFLFTLL